MTAMGCIELVDAERWLKTQEVALAMTLEALNANMKAYDHRVHDVRGYPGAQACAENIRKITEGSDLLKRPGQEGAGRVLPEVQPSGRGRRQGCPGLDEVHARSSSTTRPTIPRSSPTRSSCSPGPTSRGRPWPSVSRSWGWWSPPWAFFPNEGRTAC